MNRRHALLSAGAGLVLPRRLYAQPLPIGRPAGFQTLRPGPLWAGVPGNPPSLDLNLLTATLDASVTWTRASSATDGLFTDAAGSGLNSFTNNIPRISVAKGLLNENQKTNSLLNSGVAVTQTTGSLATGTYCLWVIGTGTATPSAGTATGAGFGVASAGVPNVFTVSVAGTVLVTVSGSLTRFQLENTAYPTSYIVTTAAAATRIVESGSLPTAAWFNAVEGTFVIDFMQPQIGTPNLLDLPSLYTAATDAVELRITSAALSAVSWVGNVNSGAVGATGSVSANIVQRAGFSYVAATKVVGLSLNGGPVGFVTAANLPTFNQIKFGSTHSGPQDGYSRRIRYYPRALQVPELRAVTAL